MSGFLSKYISDCSPYTKPSNVVQNYTTERYCSTVESLSSYCLNGPLRVLDGEKNKNEQDLFDKWFDEQIKQYGMEVYYFSHGYSLSSHDFLYGEHTLAQYSVPMRMIMAVQLNTESILFSKFGIQADSEFTGMVTYKTFTAATSAFFQNLEPKAGDLIYLSEYGYDRPNGRSGKVFEITERRDQKAGTQINQLQGHYLWLLDARRYDYNFEPKSPKEQLMNQVYDSMMYFNPTNTGYLPTSGMNLNTYTALLSTGTAGNTGNSNASLSSDPLPYNYNPLSGFGIGCYLDGLRYLDKNKNVNERKQYEDWWKEQNNIYGIKVDYYVNNTSLSAAGNYLYGEDVLQPFSVPISMIMMVELGNDNLILSRFGIQSDADFTGIIPFKTFTNYMSAGFGLSAEPKAGDLIRLTEYGSTRIGGRDGQVFEITERTDENPLAANQLMGHYVWLIKAKRYETTFEVNAPIENLQNQVYDNLVLDEPKTDKTYTQTISAASKKIFDYEQSSKTNTPVYGEYD